MKKLNTITISRETADKLHILKRELYHRSLDQTIDYLLYELEKIKGEELIPAGKTKLPHTHNQSEGGNR